CRRGIGKGMALALAEAGADVIGVSANLEESGSEIELEVKALGRRFTAYRCDFGDRQATHRFLSQVKGEHPVIDILVSNAGTIRRGPAAEQSEQDWDSVIETNLNSHFLVAREIGKDMVARGSGKVIFTASMTSFFGMMNIVGYAASKGGIAQLTKALSNEWSKYGVNVNAIAPGYIATDLNPALRADPEANKFIVDRIPVGRWGTPDDMKGMVVFLASAASDYVCGAVIPVDGGFLGR
ncbi:MAG: SDR family oxidoreductase, partial [Chloroflexota bacterium]